MSTVKLTRDIQSLSTFKRDTTRLIAQMKRTGEPVVLTVNGKAEVVVQDAESYQELLNLKDRMEAVAGIRSGLEDVKRGEGQPLDEFADEFRKKHTIPAPPKK